YNLKSQSVTLLELVEPCDWSSRPRLLLRSGRGGSESLSAWSPDCRLRLLREDRGERGCEYRELRGERARNQVRDADNPREEETGQGWLPHPNATRKIRSD